MINTQLLDDCEISLLECQQRNGSCFNCRSQKACRKNWDKLCNKCFDEKYLPIKAVADFYNVLRLLEKERISSPAKTRAAVEGIVLLTPLQGLDFDCRACRRISTHQQLKKRLLDNIITETRKYEL
ncbi:MAG: hypothetical protein FWC26_03210 [Fibromonadales bacterium]|nr:hypothetical protein [Fibromonadales bacterium]